MNLVIQPIGENDDKAMSSIIKSVFREFNIDRPGTVYTDPSTDHLSILFRKPGAAYWIALIDGKLCGGCGYFPTAGLPEGCAELVKFYLTDQVRGKGIGSALLEKTIKEAKNHGYRQLYIESFPELSQAVSMYLKAGFYYINTLLGNSGHYACTIWMLKDL